MSDSSPHIRLDIEHYFDILFASRDNGRYEEAREYERNIVHTYNDLFEQYEIDKHAWKCLDEEREAEIARLKEQYAELEKVVREYEKRLGIPRFASTVGASDA